MDPGLGEGYAYLKKAKKVLTDINDIHLQYKIAYERELYDVQVSIDIYSYVLDHVLYTSFH